MLDAALPIVSGWENFYLIAGPSAAALIGLQFVVVALVKETPLPTSPTGVDAFTTPTIVHFGAVFTIAAILSAPWTSLAPIALLIGIGGMLGALYTLIVLRRIGRSHQGYTPVLEDWVFHVILPFVAYAVLAVTALELASHVTSALFWIAAMVLVLLFTGIHNAWDTATFLSLSMRGDSTPASDPARDRARDSVLPE